MKIKKDIKFIPIIAFIGIFIVMIVNFYMQYKIEKKIDLNFKNYEFSNDSYLQGLSIDYNSINCSGFFEYKCNIKNMNLITKINNEKKIVLISENTILKPNSINQNINIDINIQKISLGKELENILFNDYNNEKYKKIGENLKNYIFPANLHIKMNINKINKTEAIGNIEILTDTNIFSSKIKYNLYLKNKEYVEKIEVINVSEKLKKDNLNAELIIKNIPFFAKINNFEYNIKDKNIINFIYEIYRLNGENLLMKNKKLLKDFNNFILEDDREIILEKKEFINLFILQIINYKENIPNEEKSFKKILENLIKLLKENKKEITIIGKNKNNTSLEKTRALLLLDNLNTSKRYLDESFEINIYLN